MCGGQGEERTAEKKYVRTREGILEREMCGGGEGSKIISKYLVIEEIKNMVYHDRKSYEEYRDIIVKLLKIMYINV